MNQLSHSNFRVDVMTDIYAGKQHSEESLSVEFLIPFFARIFFCGTIVSSEKRVVSLQFLPNSVYLHKIYSKIRMRCYSCRWLHISRYKVVIWVCSHDWFLPFDMRIAWHPNSFNCTQQFKIFTYGLNRNENLLYWKWRKNKKLGPHVPLWWIHSNISIPSWVWFQGGTR